MSSYLIDGLIFIYDIILFFIIYILRFNLVFNRNDWFVIWLGLEINIIIFIIIVFKRYRIINIESCFKYFFVQGLGSAIFIRLFYINKEYLDIIIGLILRYKIGAGPFFFWFPSVCTGISWMSCFVLISFQKIIPLILIRVFISWVFFIIIVIGLIIGVFGSFNQRDLKCLMAYSSIYHLGWILFCILIDRKCWINYLIMYVLIIFPVVYFFSKKEIMNLLEMIKIKNKLLMIIIMLRIAGIPPFLGFFLKWFAFIEIMKVRIYYAVVLIVCSIIIFYIYFRVIYDVLLGYFSYGGWGKWFENRKDLFSLDLVCVIGMLMGLFFRLFLVL